MTLNLTAISGAVWGSNYILLMTLEKEEELRTNGNLFQEPDSTLLLSSGCGRHWPDARGIYHNNDANLFVWVNEEDQMRIVSMEKGDNVRGIIERFAKARFYKNSDISYES